MLAVGVFGVVVTLVLIVVVSRSAYHRGGARQMKDGTQVRGIVQSMAIWANNNNASYPLPSLLDPDGVTTGTSGRSLDTTANIFSILVYNGFVSPELLVSPKELSDGISIDTDYENSQPRTAFDPNAALWDPAFEADFGVGRGNVSYAHLMPDDARLGAWRDTFSSQEMVLGNRGPKVAGATRSPAGGVKAIDFDTSSLTLKIHGGPKTWEGQMGYNDGRVSFKTEMHDDALPGDDVFFLLEPDHAWKGMDHFLGVFIDAGATEADFTPIWD